MSYPSFKSSVRRSAVSGFTLVELLTVIAIIGILAAIILPVVSKVRETVQNTKCQTNLRQWGQAALLYANDHKGAYALRATANDGTTNAYWTEIRTNPKSMLYAQYFEGGAGAIETSRSCPLYPAPEAGQNKKITYLMNRPYTDSSKKTVASINAINFRTIGKPAQMLLMSEIDVIADSANPWYIGKADLQTQTNALFAADRQRHALTANAVFADGHVVAITSADIEKYGETWTRLDGSN